MAKKITGVTQSGFEYSIDANRLDDYELIELFSEVDENPLLFPKIMKIILGDQMEDLKEHLRNEDGIVSTEQMTKEITDIFSNQSIKK